MSGTADPGTDVIVDICDQSACASRYEVADGSGDWSADFSIPGGDPGEEDTWDLVPGTWGQVNQVDADGDGTAFGWGVPAPRFSVSPVDDVVGGNGWPEGALVTLTIDDPGIPGPVDYTDSQTVVWEPGTTWVRFELQGLFDVQPGHFVTLTDGVDTKEHTVTNLALTAVDPEADTVSGTADPGADVDVYAWGNPSSASRYEVADGAGNWIADLSTPGDEPGEEDTYDIVPGTGGNAHQPDDDGDSTIVDWAAGTDADSDGIPDVIDNCPAWPNPDQSLPPWPVAADDPDCDGFTTADESSIGTNPLLACGPNAWPPDITDDHVVDFQDLNAIVPFLFQAATGNERYNLSVDGAIDFQDLNAVVPFLFMSC